MDVNMNRNSDALLVTPLRPAKPTDAETLLLLFFDLQELVDLTPGEILLLKTVSMEPVVDDSCIDHDAQREAVRRIRRRLTEPRPRTERHQDLYAEPEIPSKM